MSLLREGRLKRLRLGFVSPVCSTFLNQVTQTSSLEGAERTWHVRASWDKARPASNDRMSSSRLERRIMVYVDRCGRRGDKKS